MFEDLDVLAERRSELMDLEMERKDELAKARELVKKCKQECDITHEEIIKVDERKKEINESVPKLVHALANAK